LGGFIGGIEVEKERFLGLFGNVVKIVFS
jgi:hypothetical protein